MRRKRCFTLVLTLLLLALLIAAGSALAAMGVVTAMAGARISNTIEHELAIESFLECLPALMKVAAPHQATPTSQDGVARFQVTAGRCHVECHSRAESGKLYLGAFRNGAELASRLMEMARSNGLPDANVLPQAMQESLRVPNLPAWVWFDQVIQATEFEEIFRWGLFNSEGPDRVVWSDLVTFWRPNAGIAYGLELQTQIDHDRRFWYVVVAIDGNTIRTLHWSAVP